MDLIPVTKEQQQEGVVMIDDARRQLIGVRTEPVVLGADAQDFRAVGHVTYDESSLTDVNLKVHGWITKLFVNQTGQRVTRGQTLFSLYSPELYNAEQDFLLATQGAATPSLSPGSGPSRVETLGARRAAAPAPARPERRADRRARQAGAPSESVPIASPASGFVIEKNVVEGASVDAGMRLFRIAALNKVWVEADVYEEDLAHVRVGQTATVTLDYLPGRAYDAKVAYVYPYLDPQTRTGACASSSRTRTSSCGPACTRASSSAPISDRACKSRRPPSCTRVRGGWSSSTSGRVASARRRCRVGAEVERHVRGARRPEGRRRASRPPASS